MSLKALETGLAGFFKDTGVEGLEAGDVPVNALYQRAAAEAANVTYGFTGNTATPLAKVAEWRKEAALVEQMIGRIDVEVAAPPIPGTDRTGKDPTNTFRDQSGGGSPQIERFIAAAATFLGQPYYYGGGHSGPMRAPGPVDCSGLVSQAALAIGRRDLNGLVDTQWSRGKAIPVSQARRGDLVFALWKSTPGYAGPFHVGIVVSPGKVLVGRTTGTNIQYQTIDPTFWLWARRVF